jgi:tetratricopeptide (TPR) repeat protein
MLEEQPGRRPSFVEVRQLLKPMGKKKINEKNYIQNLPDKLESKSDVEKIEYYDILGMGYDRILAYAKSFAFYEKSLKLQQKVLREFPDNRSVQVKAWQMRIASSFGRLAYESQKMGSFRQSLKFNEEALKLRKEIEEEENCHNIAVSYHSLGLNYIDLGDVNMALTCYKRSYQITCEISKKKPSLSHEERFNQASTLNSMGCCLRQLGRPNSALDHHTKALRIFSDMKEKHGFVNLERQIARVKINIGLAYKCLRMFENSLSHMQESLENAQEWFGEGKPIIANGLNNMGLLYKEMNNYGAILYIMIIKFNFDLFLLFREEY